MIANAGRRPYRFSRYCCWRCLAVGKELSPSKVTVIGSPPSKDGGLSRIWVREQAVVETIAYHAASEVLEYRLASFQSAMSAGS